MSSTLMIIWDYDSAVGQLNASYPYKFREETILQEIQNVDRILELGNTFDIQMTFACVGFAAEPGHFPYHIGDQIAKIYAAGHEIASHSWRHEWFPFLEREQVRRSLQRSKESLEKCLGKPGAVNGFVPPFSRPMSWYRKGALSLGDRVWGPRFPGANWGSLLNFVNEAGYRWCRVTHKPIWKKLRRPLPTAELSFTPWIQAKNVICVPEHYCGFDDPALALTKRAIDEDETVVIVGHPLGLSRNKSENINYLLSFMRCVADWQQQGRINTKTVTDTITSKLKQIG